MNSDFTQQQSLGGLENAEQLSLKSTVPPAKLEGYTVERLLGQGAFGQVWLGRDMNTGRQVAIKFYLYRGGMHWSLLNREVKHLVNMSTGRHIVQVLGVGWDAKPPYYVMEFLENGSLDDMLRRRGALGASEAVSLLREIAEGLSYAHGKGVLHCDLKPANVMLDHDWRPRLADFGQSRMSDEQTPSLGTLFFMAPEQADLNALPDAAWDVYAYGAIAYSLLVGSPPFRSQGLIETLDSAESLPERLKRYREMIYQAPKPREHYRCEGVDKGLCQIIDRCLAVAPEQRFANIQQVIGAIDQRHRTRTRRPLYLMGVVGPILFLLLMLVFSTRSIGVAKQESLKRVQQGALESNLFACKLAARTLENEFEALFRLVAFEAQRAELRDLVLATQRVGATQLDVIADGGEHAAEREQLRALPEQQRLTEYVFDRIRTMMIKEAAHADAAIFNSLFVTDARGNNLGIGFADPEELLRQNPAGRNFAYRSYFNGMREDGNKSVPRSDFRPTRSASLSASFRSTSTGKWKVGISAPIWASAAASEQVLEGANDGMSDEEEPIGVIVLTINLGDFELLTADQEPQGRVRFAALVDGRPGNGQGTLLQHPFLRTLENQADGKGMNSVVPQVSLQMLSRLTSSEGIVDYVDPSAKYAEGHDFAGTWIAAMQQVHLPKARSDLWVLVQERGDSVSAPVTQLVTQLQRESFIELGSLLAVMLTLWYFVFRVSQTPLQSQSPKLKNSVPVAKLLTTIDSKG